VFPTSGPTSFPLPPRAAFISMYNCGLMPFFFNFASFLSLSPLISYSELFQSALVSDERPLSATEGAIDGAAGFTVWWLAESFHRLDLLLLRLRVPMRSKFRLSVEDMLSRSERWEREVRFMIRGVLSGMPGTESSEVR
jgi:hypothetical protein